jgi:hypothetical protein
VRGPRASRGNQPPADPDHRESALGRLAILLPSTHWVQLLATTPIFWLEIASCRPLVLHSLRNAASRTRHYAQIPPGCMPRLQWGSVVDTKFDSSNHGLC